ncbi:methyl-accepting chemotaxis protein [Dechloromonas sp. ZS-1]|uniref:methyl-accepting chemotaxis protein n=1 Tax=Dechloromonas sp. ZS-1 TaxID=3138067 RepID=UPI0031FBDF5D
MALFNRMNISTRMLIIMLLSAIGFIALSTMALVEIKTTMMEDRKTKIRNLVEYAHTQLGFYDTQVKTGKLTLEQAQSLAKDALRAARYDGKEYFWINDFHPTTLMHPIKPELEGKDQTGNKDVNGKALYVEFVNVVRAQGAGFVDYYWSKPGSDAPVPKLSYVKGFEPWGWIIGTGIYIDDVDAAFKKDALLLGSLSAVVLFVLILLGYLVRTSIVRQLGGEPNEAAAIMHQVAAGDLTASVSNAPSDSLLGALDNMVRTLRGLIGEINSGANQLVDNAEQIKHASEEVAIAAERQADATSAMAAAIEELTVSSNHISDSARETEHDSHEAMSLAAQGSERVEEATLAIKNIASTATEVSARIHALEERATQVSSIANVIKDIAGQTNLLALNAAIEAARAGEQGRGFAVVADEVRKLAERTSLATTEIEQMISGIQGETVDAVSAMNTALPEVERGVELAAYASDSLRSIEAGAHRTLDRVGEVASATREQSAASTSIAQRVEDIAQMVDQTTATIRGTADSAGHLEGIALNLKQQISRFKI